MIDSSAGAPAVVLEIGSHEVILVLAGLLIVAGIGMFSYVLYKLSHAAEMAIDSWYDRKEQVMRRKAAVAALERQLGLPSP